MNIPTMTMLIGLPCSGKSSYAGKLAGSHGTVVLSSDELRKELYGSYEDQTHNKEVFLELHKRARAFLKMGINVIIDSTNISYKRRMEFLKSLNKIPCEKIAVMMATPYEVCIERNKHRDRKVPEEVIKRMYMNFWVPAKYEGFDEVETEYSGFEEHYGTPFDTYKKYKYYDQHNSHHTLTLGDHCKKAADYILRNVLRNDPSRYGYKNSLYCAAYMHDYGKSRCASFKNAKGETTEECHYYGHEHPSSYDSLFYNYYYNERYGFDDYYGPWIDKLYIAQLIVWHMRPYTAWEKSEKAKEKDRRLLGDDLFNDILLLHEADVYAH